MEVKAPLTPSLTLTHTPSGSTKTPCRLLSICLGHAALSRPKEQHYASSNPLKRQQKRVCAAQRQVFWAFVLLEELHNQVENIFLLWTETQEIFDMKRLACRLSRAAASVQLKVLTD